MKKLFFAAVAILSSYGCYAQKINQYVGTPNTVTNVRGSMVVDTVFVLPYYDTASLGSPIREGSIIYQASAKAPYVFDGTYWQNLFLGNVSGVISGRLDSIITAISAKLDAGDTANLHNEIARKIDTVAGKGLSSNDYTAAEKTKLSGIAPGAEVNVQPDWNATSGDSSIRNKPPIPTKTSDLINDANFLSAVTWAIITGKPDFFPAANMANSNLKQDSSSRTYDLNGGNIYQRDGDSMWTVTSRDSIGETLQNPGYAVSRWIRGDGRIYFDIRDRSDHVLLTRVEINRSGLYLYTGVHSADTSDPTVMIGQSGNITIPSMANSAELDSMPYFGTDGILRNRLMPKPDSIMTPGRLADTLAKHAITPKYPLVTTDTTVTVDTSSVGTAMAPKWWVKQQVAAGGGGGGSLTLNDVLTNGNTSSLGIQVSGVQSEGYVMDDGTSDLFNIPVLGTNSSGLIGAADMSQLSLLDVMINTVSGTTHTLALTDKHKMNNFTSASDVTITVPTNASVAFPIGSRIVLRRGGAGAVTISGASGVTIESPDGKVGIAHQYGLVELDKIDTNTWALYGDL